MSRENEHLIDEACRKAEEILEDCLEEEHEGLERNENGRKRKPQKVYLQQDSEKSCDTADIFRSIRQGGAYECI